MNCEFLATRVYFHHLRQVLGLCYWGVKLVFGGLGVVWECQGVMVVGSGWCNNLNALLSKICRYQRTEPFIPPPCLSQCHKCVDVVYVWVTTHLLWALLLLVGLSTVK